MAIQKKHGKGRLDKWYKLAKEKGYRARAAFKLIQLNKKYGFLEKSKVLLDLCAAPGSWCQVAAEAMPSQSLIVGVDLAPIKPIPKVTTLQHDITTDQCRTGIRQHLKNWKADTVLHDGAPNVGVAWVQDAYSQAELVLQALKLATVFLIEGGTFVTKVFRSKDYNPLLWVFKQLFTQVEATKPPSSRTVSAEIFVVCRGFKATKRIDPKFLDPRHVFAEFQEPNPNNEAKVFNPEKKKRKREGYEEGDYTQHKEVLVTEFINTTDPIAILGSANELSFKQSPNGDLAMATLNRLPETTEEIRKCCLDLKILGRREFRNLLKWRLKVRDQFGLSSKKQKQQAEEGEEVAEVEPMDEEMKLQEDLQRMREQGTAKKKKERRKENEKKQKALVRLQMNMTTPFDIGMEQVGANGEGAMFNKKSATKADEALGIASSKMEVVEESSESENDQDTDLSSDEDGDRLDEELDQMYQNYQQRREERDAKERVRRARREKDTDDFEGFSDTENQPGDGDSDDETDAETSLPLRTANSQNGLSARASMFFDQDIFQDLGIDDQDSAIEMDDPTPRQNTKQTNTTTTTKQSSSKTQVSQPARSPSPTPFSAAPTDQAIDIITAEAMTLAHSLATRSTRPTDLHDDSFNKHTFNQHSNTNLPDWFLDDESQHSKPLRPTTAAAAAAIRAKLRALNARPIKKVREAKGRKVLAAARRLEKLKKKSALLVEEEGVSEADKARGVQRLMSRARRGKMAREGRVQVVVAKGLNRGVGGRPKGVRGRYKIVDARLKKDVRAEKRAARKRK